MECVEAKLAKSWVYSARKSEIRARAVKKARLGGQVNIAVGRPNLCSELGVTFPIRHE
jgi:hypothetical protein